MLEIAGAGVAQAVQVRVAGGARKLACDWSVLQCDVAVQSCAVKTLVRDERELVFVFGVAGIVTRFTSTDNIIVIYCHRWHPARAM